MADQEEAAQPEVAQPGAVPLPAEPQAAVPAAGIYVAANVPTYQATTNTPDVKPTLFHKDFKISGEISDKPNRITFVSLIRQIEAGLRKAYPENDIVDGVFRAVVPSLPLRPYLEGRENLTIASLWKIPRAHYGEKTATELFREMTNLTQEKETAQDFLLKLLSLKQKILFVSKEEGSEVKYEEGLVKPAMIHPLYLGLTDEAIRRELKPILDDEDLMEDDLIREIGIMVSRERERKEKLKRVGAYRIDLEPEPTLEECKGQTKKSEKAKKTENYKDGALWTELQALKAELSEIKGQGLNNQPEVQQRKPPACEACKQNPTSTPCTHCWICGSDEHFKAGCKQRRKQGNGRGWYRGG